MKKQYWILTAILAIAALLRVYHIAAISLWHDEAFSALLINYPWREMFYRIGLDVHPPVYYIALRFWADLFGHSLLALRGFSAFFGVLTVWATYLFVKNAFERTSLALGATLLMAVNPFQIEYVTEARMYTFGAFFIMLSAYLLVKAFKWQQQYNEFRSQHVYLKEALRTPETLSQWRTIICRLWTYWLGFAVATSISIYTHYYLFFSAFAIGLFGFYYLITTYKTDIKQWQFFVAAYLVVGISYLPWLKMFLFQFRQVQDNYWIPKINKWSIPLTNWRMLLGTGVDASKQRTDVMLIIAVLISLYVLYRLISKENSRNKWLVVFAVVVPFIGAVLLSVKQSIYMDRYFLFAALFFTVMLAAVIFQAPRPWLSAALLTTLVIISLINWRHDWDELNVAARPGMAAAAAYVNANVSPHDYLYVGSSFEFFNFKYYNRTGVPGLLYTPGIKKVSDLPHYSGTAILTDADLIHDFNANAKHGDTVWLLWTNGFGGTKPNIPNNWVQINEHGYADVRPYVSTTIYVDQFWVR